ncbi:hypothetical protein R75461_07784 [Paraburkholderia nemoris]|uniref:DUF3383 domain-containing protein n=1 Tax=Paraburkholderia nemoris TaxID=2793076 RepID=UPI00190E1722|nr:MULTISPECIES: DUF3383 domain-containing protein [Paraburkholderia]MBK3786517.1 DUF3383 domain-containing protein [Paraburkholderia aspalathi]CAE6857285.1 hypothetical protein R75461_07784 [Paraburkholderia nemoris]
MPNTIPIDQIVKVNPGVLAAAGDAVDLNGLILTASPYAPTGEALLFADPNDVSAYFGPQSIEAQMAAICFAGYQNCTKTPGALYFAQYNEVAVPAWVRGASLAAMTLEELQAVSGAFSIVVDGVPHEADLDLSAATSFSDAAQILSTDLALDVTFDAQHQAFAVTNALTGAASTISAATGAAATALAMDAASGATVSPGADPATPGAFMDNLIANVTQNWALFTTTWEPDLAGKTAFSQWASSTGYRFGYAGYDSDPQARVAGSAACWGYTLKSQDLDGSVPLYGDCTHAAFVLGFAASLDFSRLNGRTTLAFRTQAGLVPSVTNASDAIALKANGYNWFGAYANATAQFNFAYPGAVSGEWAWLDSYLDQIWLNANLQLAMIQLLMAVGSLPYNAQGDAMIEAACMDPISRAVNFGAIRTGIALSDAQVAEIQNALGFDASPAIGAKGYYLDIQPATADIRAARASPPMTLYYTDGGSVQQLTLASIAIV